MKGSKFVLNYVHLLYHKCHKTDANSGGSYIDSPEWMKNKKATIIPLIKKTTNHELNHKECKKYSQRIAKIKHFINKYNWGGINFSSETDDYKKIEKDIVKIALYFFYAKKENDILYCCFKT